MKVKALKSFTGAISMYAGEVRDIRTQIILDDPVSYTHLDVYKRQDIPMEGRNGETI